MNDILKDYTQEEIEELAIKQIQSDNFDDTPLKIVKIDKEYKKHNQKAVTRTIINGTIILTCAGIVLNSDSNIANFGTDDLSNLFNNITETISFLPKSDILVAVYGKMFDGINFIIEKIGLMGIILSTKSIKFILSTVKDTKKTLKMKKELLDLKQSIEEKNNIKIELDERINERIFGINYLKDLPSDFNKISFDDKDFKMTNGESFNEVDERFIKSRK